MEILVPSLVCYSIDLLSTSQEMSLFLHTVSGGTIDFNGGHILPRDSFAAACDEHTLAHVGAVESDRLGDSGFLSHLDLEQLYAMVWRHQCGVSIHSNKRPYIRPWDTDDVDITNEDLAHTLANKPRRLSFPLKPTSVTTKTKESALKVASRTQKQASRLHIIGPILNAFSSDPLRGLTLGRSSLAICGTCLLSQDSHS